MASKYAARSLTIDFEGEAISGVTSFGTFGSNRDQIDASAYNEDWKSYVTGQQDGDELPITIAYDPDDTGHAAVEDAYDNAPDDTVTFTITHVPTGAAWDITCILTSLNRGGQLGELFQLNVGAKIVEPGVVRVAS